MADMFGVIASAAGIAGVAGQTLDGIQKLQTFCRDVRDAPEEIQNMADELEHLFAAITHIDTQIQRNARLYCDFNPMATLRYVRRSAETTDAIVREMNNEISRNRRLGSLRMAWNRKTLDAYMTKIQRAQGLLALAMSTYNMELQRQDFATTHAKLDQLTSSIMMLAASHQTQLVSMPPHCQSDPSQRPMTSAKPKAKEHIRTVNDQKYGQGSDSTHGGSRVLSVTLSLPYWLIQRTWEINIYRAAQGWDITLRAYRTVSWQCELFQAVRARDFEVVREVLNSGKATVYDRDIQGNTALHVLAQYASVTAIDGPYDDVARFMIHRGADVNVSNFEGQLPIHQYDSLLYWDWGLLNNAVDYNIYQCLSAGINLEAEDFWKPYGESYHPVNPDLTAYLKRDFPSDMPDHTFDEQLASFSSSATPLGLPPTSLFDKTEIDNLVDLYLRLSDTLQRDMMRVVLSSWGIVSGLGMKPNMEMWQDLVRTMLAKGADFSVLCGEAQGGMDDVIRVFASRFARSDKTKNACVDESQHLLAGLKSFLAQMSPLGLRLSAAAPLARQEVSIEGNFDRPSSVGLAPKADAESYDFSFMYDLETSDWLVWVSTSERWNGEFWDMVERG